jgi:hypothetical protein
MIHHQSERVTFAREASFPWDFSWHHSRTIGGIMALHCRDQQHAQKDGPNGRLWGLLVENDTFFSQRQDVHLTDLGRHLGCSLAVDEFACPSCVAESKVLIVFHELFGVMFAQYMNIMCAFKLIPHTSFCALTEIHHLLQADAKRALQFKSELKLSRMNWDVSRYHTQTPLIQCRL